MKLVCTLKEQLGIIHTALCNYPYYQNSITFLLYAGGDFGEQNFNLLLKLNRRNELDLTTSAPLA